MHLNRRRLNRDIYEYFAVNLAPLLGWTNPILVYQMGKVGSSSIRNSLLKCPDPATRLVLMSHEFYPLRTRDPDRIIIEPELREHVLREMKLDRENYARLGLPQRLRLRLREKFYSEKIYQAYVKPGHSLRVITLVRDPVAANISMFFQLFEKYTRISIEQSDLTTKDIIRIFLDRYFHWRPLIWLDAELKTTLGIDVYQLRLSPRQGFCAAGKGNTRLLVIKSELEDRVKEHAISEFLGIKQFQITRSNVTANKIYGRKEEDFKRRIRLPEQLLDEMYNSKFARFFYSEEELAAFRLRWSGGSEVNCQKASSTDSSSG